MIWITNLSNNAKPIRKCDGCKGTFMRELLTLTSLNQMLCSKCFNKRKKAKNDLLNATTDNNQCNHLNNSDKD